MRKLRVKLRNATIYPPWGQVFKISFFLQKQTLPASDMLDLLEGDIWKVSMRKIRDIFNPGPYKSQFFVKWVDALLFQENGLAITFTWKNEPKYIHLLSHRGDTWSTAATWLYRQWRSGGIGWLAYDKYLMRLFVEEPWLHRVC